MNYSEFLDYYHHYQKMQYEYEYQKYMSWRDDLFQFVKKMKNYYLK